MTLRESIRMTEQATTLNPHAALIYVMVVVSAADARMSDAELHTIGDTVRSLPVFRGFHDDKIIPVARECAAILQEREGLDAIIGLVKEALSPSLRETAYVLALRFGLLPENLVSKAGQQLVANVEKFIVYGFPALFNVIEFDAGDAVTVIFPRGLTL